MTDTQGEPVLFPASITPAGHVEPAPRRVRGRLGGRPVHARLLTTVRLASAAIFVVFGAGKFVNHASELASFRSYGLPLAGLLVVVVGALELGGGLLLAARRATVPVALALAVDMVVAIAVSGIAHGEQISLTLAPALLIGMVCVVVDERRRRRG